MRKLGEGEHLLVKNIIKSDRPELRDNMSSIIKQKPNRKILGIFRFHLTVYNLANHGKENKFKKWLKYTVGEEPVLLDSGLAFKSSEQIEILLQNNGYFNAEVKDSIVYINKKAKVYYVTTSNEPYYNRNLEYQIPDTAIRRIVFSDTTKSIIRSGELYSSSKLQKERERVNMLIRNEGYYFFNPQYITFQVDTALNNHQLDLFMNISNPVAALRDTLISPDSALIHRKSSIDQVYVQMDYDPIVANEEGERDTLVLNDYNFLSSLQKTYMYKPRRLLDQFFIKPNTLFSQDNLSLTYNRLGDLGAFRFVNIKFTPNPYLDSLGQIPLKCFILLSPQPRQVVKLELDGTNSGGNFGIYGNITYRNRNFLGGAETFEFRLKGGLEVQKNISDSTDKTGGALGIFNAYEFGPEATINFPRFLLPIGIINQRNISNPRTSISLGFNVQNRLEYFRQLLTLSYYYSFKHGKYSRNFIYPAEINFLHVVLDPAFEAQVLATGDYNLLLSYSDQFITNGRYSYIYTNQDLKRNRNYSFFRFNLEFAGNTLYLYSKATNAVRDSAADSYLILNVPYAQYVRPDFDYRLYKVYDRGRVFVSRFAAGIGVAYGNINQMPYEKSFFAGGANDLRAWISRSLGPGSYQSTEDFEKNGELKLNWNFEYRFDIYKWFKGAAFIDAGNVWLIHNVESRPGGTFQFNSFINEIAIGAGLGLRVDFSFFVIRLDGAVKMKDPSLPANERWLYKSTTPSDAVLSFGIGYPF